MYVPTLMNAGPHLASWMLKENWRSWATPMKHHAFSSLEATTKACSDIVFALAALKLNDRHQVVLRKSSDRLHETIVQWTKGGRRGDPIAEVVAQQDT